MDGWITDIDVSQNISVVLELKGKSKKQNQLVKSLPRKLSSLYCVRFSVKRGSFDMFQWNRVSMLSISWAFDEAIHGGAAEVVANVCRCLRCTYLPLKTLLLVQVCQDSDSLNSILDDVGTQMCFSEQRRQPP